MTKLPQPRSADGRFRRRLPSDPQPEKKELSPEEEAARLAALGPIGARRKASEGRLTNKQLGLGPTKKEIAMARRIPGNRYVDRGGIGGKLSTKPEGLAIAERLSYLGLGQMTISKVFGCGISALQNIIKRDQVLADAIARGKERRRLELYKIEAAGRGPLPDEEIHWDGSRWQMGPAPELPPLRNVDDDSVVPSKRRRKSLLEDPNPFGLGKRKSPGLIIG